MIFSKILYIYSKWSNQFNFLIFFSKQKNSFLFYSCSVTDFVFVFIIKYNYIINTINFPLFFFFTIIYNLNTLLLKLISQWLSYAYLSAYQCVFRLFLFEFIFYLISIFNVKNYLCYFFFNFFVYFKNKLF